ncbi:MAG: hypothetical protein ACI9KE_000275 [Polyangiales bacterium]
MDVIVETHQGRYPLNLKMIPDEAAELVRTLNESKVEGKMEALTRSGYRGVRVKEDADAEVVEDTKIDSDHNTVD